MIYHLPFGKNRQSSIISLSLGGAGNRQWGFTLVELLVVIAVLGVLASGLFVTINPVEQLKKSRDAQRKSDLAQIQKALETYNIDNHSYPVGIPFGSSWEPYMAKVPQDPRGEGDAYKYQLDSGGGYKLYAKLERCSDSQVISATTCDPGEYNYGVVSANLTPAPYVSVTSAPIPTATITSAPGPTATPTSTPTVTPTQVLCQDGTAEQVYSSSMVGCDGNNVATACNTAVSHVCNLDEYLANGGATIPQANGSFRSLNNLVSYRGNCGGGNYFYDNNASSLTERLVSSNTKIGSFISCGQNQGYYGHVPYTQTNIGALCCSGKRVFVTSTTYSGDLKTAANNLLGPAVNTGLEGADKICQERANTARLGGTWKAWLSSSSISAASRLSHSSSPYKLINGTLVANNWNDLVDGSIAHQIDITEAGNLMDENLTWTNTGTTGEIYETLANNTCADWTSSIRSAGMPGIGGIHYTDGRWTEVSVWICDVGIHLYCFEQ